MATEWTFDVTPPPADVSDGLSAALIDHLLRQAYEQGKAAGRGETEATMKGVWEERARLLGIRDGRKEVLDEVRRLSSYVIGLHDAAAMIAHQSPSIDRVRHFANLLHPAYFKVLREDGS